MGEQATTEIERPTCIAFLVFLLFLIAGSFVVVAIPLKSLLIWLIGAGMGFLFGVLVFVEFQMDQEKRRERTTTNRVG